MSDRPMHPVALWLANLLVPGAGLVVIGRVATGVVWAAVWGVAAGGWLVVVLLRPDLSGTIWAPAFGVAAVTWYVAGQALLTYWRRAAARHRASAARDELFKSALVAYLRGRLEESESICRRLLRLDRDDVEATLQLAAVARRRGDAGAARRYLGRARYLDEAGRWDFEIERELAALAESSIPSHR